MSKPVQPSESVVVEPNLTGKQLGDYRILRRLGRGGMAVVYLAEQLSLDRKVAFKVLKRSLARDESYVQRFLHEARAAASLVHANIVQIHEVGKIDGFHFIAQEYVAGQNLRQVVDRHGPLDAAAVASIMRQVAAALNKAAEQGVTHRDIKPENIMLAKSGEVKVADFGLARAAHDEVALNLTQAGMTMGTPLYMSPEQVEGKEVGPPSDIYSLGVTCYHVLAGRAPFAGETPLAVAMQHLRDTPQRLEELRADLPQGLCRIVHKMLAKKPEDRYQNAKQVLRDLRDLHLEDVGAWPEGMDDWGTPEMLALSEARAEATQRLDTLMKSERRSRKRMSLWLLVGVPVLLTAFAVGALAAWMTRPAPLLEIDEQKRPVIEQLESAQEQYEMARAMNTEEWLLSVERHFPPEQSAQNELYGRWATLRLAELYVQQQQFDRAMAMYTTLANVDDEKKFRALGRGGQALIHARRGNWTQAQQAYEEFYQLRDEIGSRDMVRRIQDSYERYRGEDSRE